MESIQEKIKHMQQYELQKQRARQKMWFLYGSMLCVLLGRTMILPILKFYADELNKNAKGIPNNRSNVTEETKWILPDMYQGLLVSLFYLCYGTSSIFSGQLANKYGRRPVILAGLIGMSTGFVLQACATNYWFLVGARCFAGIFAPIAGVCQAYINDIVDPSELPVYTAVIGNIWGLGYAGGPMLSLIFKQLGEAMSFSRINLFKFSLFIAAILNFCMFMAAFFRLEESKDMHSKEKKLSKEHIGLERESSSNTFALVIVVVAGFFYEACSSTHGALYPQMMGQSGINSNWNEIHFSFLFTLWGAAFFLIQKFYPFIESRLGVSWVQISSALISFVVIGGCVLVAKSMKGFDDWALVAGLFPWTIFTGIAHGLNTTSAASFICQIADPTNAARWLGIWGGTTCVGCMMGLPWLVIAQNTTIWYAYIACISCSLIAAALLLLTVKTDREMQMEKSLSEALPYPSDAQTSYETFSTTAYSKISEVVGNTEIIEKVASAPVNCHDFPLLSPLVNVSCENDDNNPSIFNLDLAEMEHSVSATHEKAASSLLPIMESQKFVPPQQKQMKEFSHLPIFSVSRTTSIDTTAENETNIEPDPHVRGRIDVESRTIVPVDPESPLSRDFENEEEEEECVAIESEIRISDSMMSTDLPTIPDGGQFEEQQDDSFEPGPTVQ